MVEAMVSSCHDIIIEKLKDFYDQGIPPVFERDLSLGPLQNPDRGNLVQVVVGVRRCGKTYRLYQEMHRILREGFDLSSILYFNFDDERLKPYETAMLEDVVESYFALNPQAKKEGAFFFFDEIQEVPEWGSFMRRMVDTQRATIYVTGSSSKMLSLHLASEFRGRALSREMFPLSFAEFIRFHDQDQQFTRESLKDPTSFTSAQKSFARNAFGRYLEKGGFIPAQNLDSSDAIQLLQEFANRTVNYDIIERYNIGNPRAAALFLSRALASSGRELSISKVYNQFKSRQITIGRETLSRLLSYYEESFLLFSVANYSVALADNTRSSAKIYAVDPALFTAFSPSASHDIGQKLETTVFDHLRRRASARPGSIARAFVGEGASRHEIDFIVGDALALEQIEIIQVSTRIDDRKTFNREISALDKAMVQFECAESTLVTLEDERNIETDAGIVHAVPAWKWLLS